MCRKFEKKPKYLIDWGQKSLKKEGRVKVFSFFNIEGVRKSLDLFIEKRGENNNGKQGGLPKKDSGD